MFYCICDVAANAEELVIIVNGVAVAETYANIYN